MAAHSSILAWKTPQTEEPTEVGYSPWGCKESGTTSTTEHVMKNNLKKNKYIYICVCVLVTQWCLTFRGPRDCIHQVPLSMEFSRREHWSELPFPSPGDIPNPGLELGFLTLQTDSLPFEPSGKPISVCVCVCVYKMYIRSC